jgi:hypothetical protein
MRETPPPIDTEGQRVVLRSGRSLNDSVAKVAEEKLWYRNTQQSNRGCPLFQSPLVLAPNLDCASMMERQIDRPMPRPPGFVV